MVLWMGVAAGDLSADEGIMMVGNAALPSCCSCCTARHTHSTTAPPPSTLVGLRAPPHRQPPAMVEEEEELMRGMVLVAIGRGCNGTAACFTYTATMCGLDG